MRLCLHCYRLWPREAVFCGHCARTFGGRLCPHRHRNPVSAQVCVQCGKSELTDAAPSLSLGWLSALASLLCVVLLFWGGVGLLPFLLHTRLVGGLVRLAIDLLLLQVLLRAILPKALYRPLAEMGTTAWQQTLRLARGIGKITIALCRSSSSPRS